MVGMRFVLTDQVWVRFGDTYLKSMGSGGFTEGLANSAYLSELQHYAGPKMLA